MLRAPAPSHWRAGVRWRAGLVGAQRSAGVRRAGGADARAAAGGQVREAERSAMARGADEYAEPLGARQDLRCALACADRVLCIGFRLQNAVRGCRISLAELTTWKTPQGKSESASEPMHKTRSAPVLEESLCKTRIGISQIGPSNKTLPALRKAPPVRRKGASRGAGRGVLGDPIRPPLAAVRRGRRARRADPLLRRRFGVGDTPPPVVKNHRNRRGGKGSPCWGVPSFLPYASKSPQ